METVRTKDVIQTKRSRSAPGAAAQTALKRQSSGLIIEVLVNYTHLARPKGKVRQRHTHKK